MYWTINYLSQFEENKIFIHYDKKSNIKEVKELERDNVFFIDQRMDVRWGQFSQIQAIINLLRCAEKIDFDYCLLISGDCIPACSNSCMNAELEKHMGKEFVHYQDQRSNYVDPLPRVKYIYPNFFFKKNKNLLQKLMVRGHFFARRFFFKNYCWNAFCEKEKISLYKGTAWFNLTKNAVSYIVSYIDKNNDLLQCFEHSYCADEVFFHSVLKTSKDMEFYSDPRARSDALRYIDWETGPQKPRELDATDIPFIESSGCFFARKVKYSISEKEFEKFKCLVGGRIIRSC